MIVSRMTKGTARLDGKGKGRRALLSETAEGNLLLVLQRVIDEGRIPVTYSVVKALAEIEWRSENWKSLKLMIRQTFHRFGLRGV